MGLFLASFLIMAIAVAAMSIGVIVGNRQIKGSCGHLAALGIERACDCPDPCEKRKRKMAAAASQGEQIIRFR